MSIIRMCFAIGVPSNMQEVTYLSGGMYLRREGSLSYIMTSAINSNPTIDEAIMALQNLKEILKPMTEIRFNASIHGSIIDGRLILDHNEIAIFSDDTGKILKRIHPDEFLGTSTWCPIDEDTNKK